MEVVNLGTNATKLCALLQIDSKNRIPLNVYIAKNDTFEKPPVSVQYVIGNIKPDNSK